MQWMMLQQPVPEDFVIATGVQRSVRDFVDAAARVLDMNIRWEGEGVDEKGNFATAAPSSSSVDPRYFRPTEVETLLGDASKAHEKLGWKAEDVFRGAGRGNGARRFPGCRAFGEVEPTWLRRLYDLTGKRVFVCGPRGMVGSALVRRLGREGCTILTATRRELDLKDQAAVDRWMAENRPHAVFLAAAKVGGILANETYPADFLYDNLMIEANVIPAAHRCGVEKLLFLGSSCIYPKLAPQPITEETLLTGPLEPTNEWYAIAKIAGIKLCQAYPPAARRGFHLGDADQPLRARRQFRPGDRAMSCPP